MKFKTAALELEWQGLHPEVRTALMDLETFSKDNGLPEVVVTHIMRTPDFQEETYWKRFALGYNCAEKEARKLARKKFSWHLVSCAADIRNKHYTKLQRAQVVMRLQSGRTKPMWEVLEHDVGRGDHIHIGRQDFNWRSDYERRFPRT